MRNPGAKPRDETTTDFRVWAPRARRVEVELVGAGERVPLEAVEEGWFSGLVPCGPGARYRYVLDGGTPQADPASRFQPDGVYGPSGVVILDNHAWRDDGFLAGAAAGRSAL